jgi:hypothetical protein
VRAPAAVRTHRSPNFAQTQDGAVEPRRPRRSAAPRAFSLTTRITQRDGRGRTRRAVAPAFRGTAASRSPGRWISPGWRPSPRSPRCLGTRPAAGPSWSPSSSLGGIKASRPGLLLTPRRDRDQLHRGSDGPCGAHGRRGCQGRDDPGRPCRRQMRAFSMRSATHSYTACRPAR